MKKLALGLALVAVLLFISGAVLVNGRQAAPFPENSGSAQRLQPGPLEVHSHDEEFVDTSRATAANGDFPGEDLRRLAATVWHPANNAAGPYPLVVYSHGFSSNREGGAYLGRHLASHGFVVVAVDYPLTHFDAPGGPYVRDVLNQPADVSFLIDTLVAQSNTAGHMLEGMVDPGRIGATGISLGGLTTTLAAYHPDLRDPRIGAALSIAGPTALFTEVFFTHADLPFLMLAGDIDALVPYPSNAAPVPDKVPGGELVTIANASHTGFAGTSAPLRWLDNPDSIGCWAVQRNISQGDVEEPWYDQIGSEEQGINYYAMNELCLMDPLPVAMNPLRQQMITAVVVASFFQAHLAGSEQDRAAARSFLQDRLAEELAEVSYRR